MHVAFLIDRLNTGGVQKAILQICSTSIFSNNRKSIVSLVRSQGDMRCDFLSAGFSLHECPILLHDLPKRPYRLWKFFKQAYGLIGAIPLYRLLMKIKPDVVHSHLNRAITTQLLAAYWSHIPIVLTLQGAFKLSWHDRVLLKSLLPRFSASRLLFTAVSRTLGQHLEVVDEDRIQTIPNPVDLEVFTSNHLSADKMRTIREALAISSEDNIIVGSVGRLEYEKGYDVLIRAAAQVLKKFPRAQFIIVGDGTCKNELDLLAKALNIHHSVKLVGVRRDIPDLLRLFDVYVQPSRSEGQPLATTEAMASGIPVVASAVGGLDELLRLDFAGMLVSPDNPDELSERLCYLLADASLRKEISLKAMNKVRQFDVNLVAQLYSNLYRRTAAVQT